MPWEVCHDHRPSPWCKHAGSGCGPTGDVPALASATVQALLVLHFGSWTAPDSGRAASPYPSDGTRQHHVGLATHRQRTPAQARLAGLAAHRPEVHTPISRSSVRPSRTLPTLADLRAQSRTRADRQWHGRGSPHPRRPGLIRSRHAHPSAVVGPSYRERATEDLGA